MRAWRRAAAMLLASTALVAAPLLLTSVARAQDATWLLNPVSANFNSAANWTPSTVPTGIASFGTSATTALSFSTTTTVGGWTFNAGASAFTFANNQVLGFNGTGIVINGGSATITNNNTLRFFNASTAGSANITNTLILQFADTSTAGSANITNTLILQFAGTSTAGSASITNNNTLQFFNASTAGSANITNNNTLVFFGSSTAGNAAIINAGTADFSASTGPAGDSKLSAGSIAGVGSFILGARELTVGGNNLSTEVSGVISGAGGALVKAGTGLLILSGANTYSGATNVNAGTLQAGAANTFSPASAFTVAAGATLALNNFNQVVGSLAGAGNVTLGSATLTAGGDNTSTTFAGVISGTGGVTKAGAGTTILTGANTYTGGTTINAGTLQLGNGGAGGSIAGNVLNNATLAFNRTDASTFGGVVSGTGALTKAGAGNLVLSGNNTYTGNTTINGGTLAVNGSTATSALTTVNAGGTLGGTGTVGNTTIAGGTLAPGNSIGTINVQGNLVFSAASTYLVEIDPNTSDRTNVTGTATLGGATVSAIYAAGSYVSKRYTILNAAGGVSGTFNTLVNTNLPANFTPSLNYDPNNAYLDLTLNFTPPSPPTSPNFGNGLSGNQNSVASALINSFNTAGSIPLVFGLLTPQGLTQLSGEAATGAALSATQMMNAFLSLTLNPYGGSPTGNSGALGYARAFGANEAALPKQAADAYAADMPVKAAPPAGIAVPGGSWSVWGQGYGGHNKTDGNLVVGSHDTTARTYGFAAGADYRVSPATTVGFALAGGELNWNLSQGLGSGKSDVFQAGIYGSHRFGAAYVSAALAYAWYDMSTDRTVTAAGNDLLRASFDAHNIGGRLEGGYRFAMSSWGGVTPYGAVQVQRFRTPNYSEVAGFGNNTFALSYNSNSTTASRFELGSWFDHLFAFNNGNAIMLRGRLAWAHDDGNNGAISSVFQTLPGAGFTVNGAAPPQNLALASVGAELRLVNNVSLGARFDGEFSDRATTYAGTGTVRYTW